MERIKSLFLLLLLALFSFRGVDSGRRFSVNNKNEVVELQMYATEFHWKFSQPSDRTTTDADVKFITDILRTQDFTNFYNSSTSPSKALGHDVTSYSITALGHASIFYINNEGRVHERYYTDDDTLTYESRMHISHDLGPIYKRSPFQMTKVTTTPLPPIVAITTASNNLYYTGVIASTYDGRVLQREVSLIDGNLRWVDISPKIPNNVDLEIVTGGLKVSTSIYYLAVTGQVCELVFHSPYPSWNVFETQMEQSDLSLLAVLTSSSSSKKMFLAFSLATREILEYGKNGWQVIAFDNRISSVIDKKGAEDLDDADFPSLYFMTSNIINTTSVIVLEFQYDAELGNHIWIEHELETTSDSCTLALSLTILYEGGQIIVPCNKELSSVLFIYDLNNNVVIKKVKTLYSEERTSHISHKLDILMSKKTTLIVSKNSQSLNDKSIITFVL